MLRALFERLDTTPGQEKVIVAAADEARQAGRDAWESVRSSRADMAQALRGEVFDEAAVAAAKSRHEEAHAKVHEAFTSAMRKVHEALDSRQRSILADLLAEGPRGWRGGFGYGGPYRSA